ncbi:MAG: S8 family serine peptidase [bacterium]|nr:S8 family serine peptidase [bacterium]
MFRITFHLCVLTVALSSFTTLADVDDLAARNTRIAVADAPSVPVPVAAWDPASPQKLVRLEGKLYQEDTGFFYPVHEDRLTVRLAEDVRDWDDLIDRAGRVDPAAFSLLDQLVPQRMNKLGIVDLAIPDDDPTAWCELLHSSGLVRYAEVVGSGVYLVEPDDPQYSQQWALNNTGQTGGTAGADIDAEAAWDITTGDPAIQVGVLDSGTYVDHEDLLLNVWHNPGEIPDNSIDDDGNGFVDDWEGWDFGNGNNDPRSSNFHGTHVTGIINANGGNDAGIVGLAGGIGGPGVQGMAIAVGESGPNGGILDDAIIYAADNGAAVITMSLSVGESTAINDALEYAYATKDVFIDCAAGNNGSSVGYPARRPQVMAIASTDHNDNRSSFSNPGPEVEVAAPGSNIRSTQLAGTYGNSSGTSFAAPYVAGLAALVRGLNPGLPAPDVRQLLIDTAVDVESPGFDNLTGWGRIDAAAAVAATADSDGDVRLDAGVYSCAASIVVTVSDFDLAGGGTVAVTLSSGVEPAGESLTLFETAALSGIFEGTIATGQGAPAADGVLQLVHADSISAEYIDADDGDGNTNVVNTANASTDCLGPVLYDVSVGQIDDDSAVVTWSSDEGSTSVVHYGTFVPPDQQAGAAGLTTVHSVTLNGLDSCTSYRFSIESVDAVGNVSVNDLGGLYFGFETYIDIPGSGVVPCQEGQAALDKATYACSDTALVSVTDVGLGSDPQAIETVQVRVTSTSEPAGEWLTLTELTADNARFEGTIPLDAGAAAADGQLSASDGDLISVTYYDADDGNGESRVDSTTSLADCSGPMIRNLRVLSVTSTRADIEWTTTEPATSRVEYGLSAGLGAEATDAALSTSHSLTLSAFDGCDEIFFRVSGVDGLGNEHVADVAGAPFVFKLSRIGGLLFHDNFESVNGWTLPGEWEIGAPQGLGSSNSDPAEAYSGSGVLGTDLGGGGTFPGDYEPTIKDWAKTPVLDATGFSDLEVVIRRKLGVTSSDMAAVAIFDPGQHNVWVASSSMDDDDWVETRYDVSAHADGNPTAQVGFGIQSIDPGQSFGWNIDELFVKDATQPDYIACGDCDGRPTFGGLTAAFDAAPCGVSGVTLEWEIAPAWGSGLGGTYEMHRGTSAGFNPDASNRIATGLTGTTWVDSSAPVDVPLWYVVRARNDQSCAGGEGESDANLVRVAAMETVAQSVPPSLGQTVRLDLVGGAHVRLSWDAVPGAVGYKVLRGNGAGFDNFVEVGTTDATYYEDASIAADGNFYAYRIVAVNACGVDGP